MSTAMLGWITGRVLPTALFFEGTFASGPVYLWTGYGPIQWNGQTWTGIGTLGSVSPVGEGSTVEAKGLTVTLSGIDPTTLADVLGEFLLGAAMALSLGGFNDGVLIADPIPAFVARMDQPTIDIDAKTATLSINCESRLVDMDVAVDRRYTPEDQQRDWPGDLGMTFVPSIQEITIFWGQAPTSSGNI
jgi:hypothetical protein